jgi:hypothetical protein
VATVQISVRTGISLQDFVMFAVAHMFVRRRPQLARFFATASALPKHRLMPMPRLSPTMKTGHVVRWNMAVGDRVDDMEVACEVKTAELTDDPEDGEKILEIEAHEDGYLAAILVEAGEQAQPDEAIAVIVHHHSDIGAFQDSESQRTLTRQLVEPATFAWQAYLKAGQTARGCSNS